MTGVAIFIVSSGIGGGAASTGTLVAGRSIIGIGGAGAAARDWKVSRHGIRCLRDWLGSGFACRRSNCPGRRMEMDILGKKTHDL